MFFYASKILGFFAIPSNFVILVGIAGALLLRTRFSRAGWRLVIASLVAARGARALAGRQCADRAAGGALPALGPRPRRAARHRRAGRRAHARRLARPQRRGAQRGRRAHDRGRRARAALSATRASSSPAARRGHFRRSGRRRNSRCGCSRASASRRGRIVAEDKSRNTVENARFLQDAGAAEAGRALAAGHLRLSHAALDRASSARPDFPVEAYPVDWRTRGTGDALRPFPTLGDGLRRTDTAVREWIGLVVYWLTGQSSELFPGPIRRGDCDRASLDNCRP